MFSVEENGKINIPKPLLSASAEYRNAYRNLQMVILKGEPDNLKEIGRCFEELKEKLRNLMNYFLSTV